MKYESNSDLDQFFQSSSGPNVGFSTSDKDRVLGLILSLGTSYPAEISRYLLLRVEQIHAIVQKLINENKLKRLVLNNEVVHPLIRVRLQDLWNQNIEGYKEFNRRSWVAITEEGIYYFVNKFRGEHRKANTAYLEVYPDIQLLE